MTFKRMLYEMSKNPKLTFKSEWRGMYKQDYKSIVFWLFKDKGKDSRAYNARKILTATDWTEETK